MTGPLVSCVMVTAHRPAWVPQAIACFQRQSYPNRELVIFDNGDISIEHLVPTGPDIRYPIRYHKKGRNTPEMRLGAMVNIANDLANGSIIATWDDDDWSAPERLAVQVKLLEDCDLTGFNSMYFVDQRRSREPIVWAYTAGVGSYAIGTSQTYRKDLWRARPMVDADYGYDNVLAEGLKLNTPGGLDPMLMVARIHGHCTSPKVTAGPQWEPVEDLALAARVRAVF